MTLIATDGSCSNNGGVGAKAGFGVVCEDGSTVYGPVLPFRVKEIQYPATIYHPNAKQAPTNNRGELMAILYALHLMKTKPVGQFTIVTDSTYCRNIFTGWLDKWIAEGTLHSKLNQDIILIIDNMFKEVRALGYVIEMVWQKAHLPKSVSRDVFSRLNEKADDLADKGRLSSQVAVNH